MSQTGGCRCGCGGHGKRNEQDERAAAPAVAQPVGEGYRPEPVQTSPEVVDAVGGTVRVRITVSAPNAGALWDLQCFIREGMVVWLQNSRGGALPRWRFEPAPAPESVPQPRREFSRAGARADHGLFSGSDAAEERNRAFDGPPDDKQA
mgnify:CR=1 FL=1